MPNPPDMRADRLPPSPSREAVRRRLVGLLNGTGSRDEAAAWAWQWVAAGDPGVVDPVVWQALNALAGAASPSTDRTYLYERADFEAWLAEFGENERPDLLA